MVNVESVDRGLRPYRARLFVVLVIGKVQCVFVSLKQVIFSPHA